ncbi:MAG TPA: hypothetical protein PLK12_10625 [Prolixibacteraceae bacterium]|nr:hypothetical protein [Prolixibacteraceae bacterium]
MQAILPTHDASVSKKNLDDPERTNRNDILPIFFHVLLPLTGGTIIYGLWRGILLFGWDPVLSADPPEWILYNLPDALWLYAFLSALTYVWDGERSGKGARWLLLALFLALFSESLQALSLIPGTFDVWDAGAYLLAFLAAGTVHRKFHFIHKPKIKAS